jgi:hypothetical protein
MIQISFKEPDWKAQYARKCFNYDQMFAYCQHLNNKIESLGKLMAELHEQANKPGWMPDEQSDKIARTTAGAIAERMAKILTEQAEAQ